MIASVKQRSILIFCEGSKTEPMYLTHWQRLHRDRVRVVVDAFHGPPLKLVERAAARRADELRHARHGRAGLHDEYWCVFDVDEHPNIGRALGLARAHGIRVAVSNPCIEMWFLLHFQDWGAAIDRGEAQRRSSDLLGCGKVLTPSALSALAGSFPVARHHARALDSKHALDGSPPRSNPSSGVWRLIDSIRGPASSPVAGMIAKDLGHLGPDLFGGWVPQLPIEWVRVPQL